MLHGRGPNNVSRLGRTVLRISIVGKRPESDIGSVPFGRRSQSMVALGEKSVSSRAITEH